MKRKLNCVMLIDDNEDDNFFHQIILNDLKITKHIQVAESGFEALEYLQKGEQLPDLIFLDINMPKMNGWEFLEEYDKLKLSINSGLVIIVLTTSLNPSDKEKSRKINLISGFECKPLNEEIVNRILNSFFRNHADGSI